MNMKKTILSVALLTITATAVTTQAANELSFEEQLNMQKTQLHPQEFNFFSDRYKQMKAHKQFSLKTQLDSQKESLRDYNTYPAASASYQNVVNRSSFKTQLDSQKEQLRPQNFSFVSDAYYQVISRKAY